jgi:hypothetical protein
MASTTIPARAKARSTSGADTVNRHVVRVKLAYAAEEACAVPEQHRLDPPAGRG